MSDGVEVHINDKAIVNRVENILDNDTRLKMVETFAKLVDPWTPFKSGQLHDDITIEPDGVTYNVPYASSKYYGTVYTETIHPLATSHWDEVALQVVGEDLESIVRDILIARVKELYG